MDGEAIENIYSINMCRLQRVEPFAVRTVRLKPTATTRQLIKNP